MTRLIDLDSKILSDALIKLKEDRGVSYRHMERTSGASNVSSIANGTLAPTIATWGKLHLAFPLDIPEPVLTDGENVYTNQTITGDGNQVRSVSAGRDVIKRHDGVSFPSPEHRYAYELLMRVDKEKAKEVIKMLMES